MRWTKRSWQRGDKRINSGFLLLPKIVRTEIKGLEYYDIRWLERARWREEYWSDPTGEKWDTVEWIDET